MLLNCACDASGIFVPRPGIEPTPSSEVARNLNHWTAREVPRHSSPHPRIFYLSIFFFLHSSFFLLIEVWLLHGSPWWLSSKESACNARAAGDLGSVPGLGRPPGEGSGNPLQYSCLKNPIPEEPGGIQSVGSQRVGHDWSDLAQHINVFTVLYQFLRKFFN